MKSLKIASLILIPLSGILIGCSKAEPDVVIPTEPANSKFKLGQVGTAGGGAPQSGAVQKPSTE